MSPLRTAAKAASNLVFRAAERAGIHVAPAHYYSSTPDRRWLRANEAAWRKAASLASLGWDIDAQVDWLRDVVGHYPGEVPIAQVIQRAERVGGFRYGPIEAQVLHSWVRTKTPPRVFEIGSGSSTQIASAAVSRNVAEGRPCSEIIAVDPYVDPRVGDLPHVTVRRVGGLDLTSEDLDLGPGDLLFIDSTHAVKTGSELPHLYLELLPRLAPGVTVHIHDIYLPYLFSPTIYESQFDWQETTLVAALLTNNPRLAVRAALSALHHDRPEALGRILPEYRPAPMDRGIGSITEGRHFPSSLWLETAPRT